MPYSTRRVIIARYNLNGLLVMIWVLFIKMCFGDDDSSADDDSELICSGEFLRAGACNMRDEVLVGLTEVFDPTEPDFPLIFHFGSSVEATIKGAAVCTSFVNTSLYKSGNRPQIRIKVGLLPLRFTWYYPLEQHIRFEKDFVNGEYVFKAELAEPKVEHNEICISIYQITPQSAAFEDAFRFGREIIVIPADDDDCDEGDDGSDEDDDDDDGDED